MTEQEYNGRESNNIPETARQDVISRFKEKFDLYLDGKLNGQQEINLITLKFMPDRIPLEVSYLTGNMVTPFEYGNLDKKFEGILQPYFKQGCEVETKSEDIVLQEFPHMPVNLRRYIGTKMQRSTSVYQLSEYLDGQKTFVTKERYYYSKDERVQTFAEFWKLQLIEGEEDSPVLPQIRVAAGHI